jgi:hypothetical protein
MTGTNHRWPQFSLWSIFVLTTFVSLLLAAGLAVSRELVQVLLGSVFVPTCVITSAVLFMLLPLVLFSAGWDWMIRHLFGGKRKQ